MGGSSRLSEEVSELEKQREEIGQASAENQNRGGFKEGLCLSISRTGDDFICGCTHITLANMAIWNPLGCWKCLPLSKLPFRHHLPSHGPQMQRNPE